MSLKMPGPSPPICILSPPATSASRHRTSRNCTSSSCAVFATGPRGAHPRLAAVMRTSTGKATDWINRVDYQHVNQSPIAMILFLDFDGVLHADPCSDQTELFCRLPLLEEVLRDTPQVEIVVSSSWRECRTIDQLRNLFSADIRQRVIDVTPMAGAHQELAELIGPTYRRSIEVEAWLRASGRPWLPWIALDDKRHWFRPFTKNLVCCDPLVGLSDDDIGELRRRFLSHKCSAPIQQTRI